MKARVIKDTKIIAYPFLTIIKDSIVELSGTENEDGTIVVRVNPGTEYEKNVLINASNLEVLTE